MPYNIPLGRRLFITVYQMPYFLVLQFQVNFNDTNLFEGDIKGLTLKTILSYISQNTNQNVQSAGVRDPLRRWPNKTIPYVFDPFSFDDYSKQRLVKKAMHDIEMKTCIKFVPRSTEKDYVEIISAEISVEIISGSGCYSYVGRKGGRQELSLGSGCLEHDGILHELMHAIGFFHEQSRSDRDEYIKVHFSNMPSQEMRDQFQKYDQFKITHLNTEYDYKSVMHYPPVTSDGIRLFTPIKPGAIIQSNGLSRTDIKEINLLYNCSIKQENEEVDNETPPPMISKRCENNVFYCGSELKKLKYQNVLSDDTLYHCDMIAEANFHVNCGSAGCRESNEQSYCGCRPGAIYCGHELARFNFVFEGMNVHYLYYCHNGTYVYYRDRCQNYCMKNNDGDSYCSSALPPKCKSNALYCGYEFSNFGQKAEPNGLYRCQYNGFGTKERNCYSGCIVGKTDSSCNSGKVAQPV